MVKHWMVEVMGEQVLALGDDELHAKRFAVRRYFDLHPEKIGQVVELTSPCQWGGECPEGAINCAVCASLMADV
jgi:hypothetical protein